MMGLKARGKCSVGKLHPHFCPRRWNFLHLMLSHGGSELCSEVLGENRILALLNYYAVSFAPSRSGAC